MPIPNISIRKHFRLADDDPIEPTSTLVLTSHSSHYIDVRIYDPPPTESAPDSLSCLEWAFAGKSNSTPSTEPKGPAKAVWEHWIDSKSLTPGADEGLMYDVGGGNTLEKGTMKHPQTGKQCDYEELWGDVAVEAIGEDKTNVSVVLKVEDEDKGYKGMVVRAGGWCQGISRGKQGVVVERWKWRGLAEVKGWRPGTSPGEKPEKGGWERIARLGDGDVPCEATFAVEDLREGMRIGRGEVKWEVMETFQWT